jgi:hypothetical protein
MAEAYDPHEIGGDHFRSSAVMFTQSHPKQTMGSDVYVGTSLDQIYAQRFGQDTPIPSMQLCIENINQSGGCAYGYSCVYTDSLSWASPTEPLPVVRDPRVAFEQLFGAGATTKERVEARNTNGEARELPEAPPGVPDSFSEHMQMMFDLQVLAFQTDMTRVFSFKLGRDSSARVYPESGTETPFHPASHHGNSEEKILDFNLINKYHVSMLPYLLGKLKDTQEAGVPLLDKTMVIYGSPMGDPNIHNHLRVPFLVMGGANGKHQGGAHLKAPDYTPLANVFLTLLHKLGAEDMNGFGDSTGAFSLETNVATQ